MEDFSLPCVDWGRFKAGSVDKANGEKVLEFTFNHSLTQMVKDFIRVTGTTQSLLDLVLVIDNIRYYYVAVVDGI